MKLTMKLSLYLVFFSLIGFTLLRNKIQLSERKYVELEKLTDDVLPKKNQIQKQQNLLKPNWQRVTIAGGYDGVKMSLIDWLINSGERLFEAIEIDSLTQSSKLLWKILLGFGILVIRLALDWTFLV